MSAFFYCTAKDSKYSVAILKSFLKSDLKMIPVPGSFLYENFSCMGVIMFDTSVTLT